MNIIYHNPNWGKSRKSVEILENSGIDYNIIKYLVDTPSKEQIKNIAKMLNMKPKDFIRKGEKDFKENNLASITDNDELLIEKMIEFPKIIERPIIIIEGKAVIGRPPENILEIL